MSKYRLLRRLPEVSAGWYMSGGKHGQHPRYRFDDRNLECGRNVQVGMWTRRDFFASFVTRLGAGAICVRSGLSAKPETIFESKMISAGNNYPSLNIRANRLTEICVALHLRKALASIERDLGISSAELRDRVDSLMTAGLVKSSPSGQFLPTFMVITLEDAHWMAPPDEMVETTGRLIADRLSDIRARAESIPAIRRVGFSHSAFLILSNVLLDNWQIRNVETKFLKAERPLRNGRRYYFAIFEKQFNQQNEAFGIFGNAGLVLGNVQLGVYGNRRYGGGTLLSVSREEFARLFELPPQADANAERAALLEGMVAFARTGEECLNARQKAGLTELGLFENGELRVAVFTGAEAMKLGDVAALITSDLLGLLERYRSELQNTHERSPFSKETTFNEFFMWWYHFFYSATTHWLARQGLLEIPRSGNATYLIAD